MSPSPLAEVRLKYVLDAMECGGCREVAPGQGPLGHDLGQRHHGARPTKHGRRPRRTGPAFCDTALPLRDGLGRKSLSENVPDDFLWLTLEAIDDAEERLA